MIDVGARKNMIAMEGEQIVLEKEENKGIKFVDPESGLKILDPQKELRSHKRYWAIRRVQDVFFSILALIVLSPIFLITAIAVWIDDPNGSPIFKQVRCGRDGKPFCMYKFRSMYMDAEKKLEELIQNNEMDGPAFKIKDDPRITKVGRFIRKTSIDELPQLWNIFKGDMSIVGPRPALPREVQQYKDIWKQRMYITPGLTCYWQITPNRNDISFDDWMAMDMKYIEERAFLEDWKIIFMTVKAVIKKQGE